MSAVPLTPVDITSGLTFDSTWNTYDTSGDGVPAGAVGVMVRVTNSGNFINYGFRHPDETTWAETDWLINRDYHTWEIVPCDTGQVIEYWANTSWNTGMTVEIVGYLDGSGDVMLQTPVTLTPAGTTGWQTVDISANTTGTATVAYVLITMGDNGTAGSAGLRPRSDGDTVPVDSNDDRTNDFVSRGVGVVPIADANEEFQAFRTSGGNNANVEYYLVGYSTANFTSLQDLDATEDTPVSEDTWTDIGTDASAQMAVVEVLSSTTAATDWWGLRDPDDTGFADIVGHDHNWGYMGVDASGNIEAYRNGNGATFFPIGYWTAAADSGAPGLSQQGALGMNTLTGGFW